MYDNQAEFLFRYTVQVFLDGFADTAHGNDNMFRIGSAIIIKEAIGGSKPVIDFGKLFFYDLRQCLIKGIGSFSCLEEDVRVLRGTIYFAMGWMERPLAESFQSFHVHHIFQIRIFPDCNFV